MSITLTPLPLQEAIAAIEARGKRLHPSFSYLDVWQEEHARAWTVAKSAGFDILKDLHSSLVSALGNGETIEAWSRRIRPVLEDKGWWGRRDVMDPETGQLVSAQLGSTRRLRTIFEVNMRVSYAAGHWAQFERTKRARPWLRYVAVMDGNTRAEHAARHNMCALVDDPIWDTWAPPCGWNCRCTLQSLSEADYRRLGERAKKPPPDTPRQYLNRRTGEVTQVPAGIDPGWAYNPGKAGAHAAAAADKLIDAPPRLTAAAMRDPDWLTKPLADEFSGWVDAIAAKGPVARSIFTVHALDDEVLDFLAAQGRQPASGAITAHQAAIGHIVRDVKAGAGTAAPMDAIRRLPETLSRATAILWDKRDPALLYVFDVPGDTRLGKIVVRIDYADKVRPPGGRKETIVTNSVRTAGLVEVSRLADSQFYDLISGRLL
ncbi:phage minor head protein [Zavarzinia compransoris]|uniref:Phage head morphogenesis domain-containing protein n=1 Tax=Zavarzinia compransoris TaxID=1264899 RepID=A0A317EDC2_9PROT|nr:phage minor head protein [Zavarzinia compransoris]PWR23363.1 hypothetical protein DKG75_01995 [Zavarzinia compransoris]TDP46063.1 SPP1 gp7 family putative phage head morphogenesis protein [Zavarzinia compransoris]